MRQRWKCAILAPFVLVFGFAGCIDDDITGATAPGSLYSNASAWRTAWTHDDEMARIAREEIPGFAGYYLDGAGNDVVLLTDRKQSDRAMGFAARRRSEARLPTVRSTIIRDARWDFATLKGWHDSLLPRLLVAGLSFTDVDEVNNRLLIGIVTESARAGVRAAAGFAGIPPAALAIEISPRAETRGTLLEERTVKAGGLHIQDYGTMQWCTLGFNATWSGEAYLITASHCSDNKFGPDLDPRSAMYQPNHDAGRDSIAEEAFDPALKTDGAYPYRYSDASMFRYRAGVQREQGRIMRTTYSSSGTAGSLEVNEADPYLNISFKNTSTTEPPVGAVVQKVGRSTGWTYGSVTATCRTLFADGAQTQELICQWTTSIYSAGGDSGSPVFADAANGSVALHGLLWGGLPGDPNTTYYSPISGIETDMQKALDVVWVAPPPPAPAITAEVINGNPHLTWDAVPGALEYRIYRRITDHGSFPPWEIWNTVARTSYADVSSMVISFYGYDNYPPFERAVSYQVRAVASGGVEGAESRYATFIPEEGPLPYRIEP